MKRYLRSIGVDPARVVIQRGRLNYAGPNCPGKAWNCTRARKVVQIGNSAAGTRIERMLAARGDELPGQNRFECSPATLTYGPGPGGTLPSPLVDCEIVQFAPPRTDNVATCIEKLNTPGASEACGIEQHNADGRNRATVVQDARQTDVPEQQFSGFDQIALQTTIVKQFNTRGDNQASVTQGIEQHIKNELEETSPTHTAGAANGLDLYQQGTGLNRADVAEGYDQNIHNLGGDVFDIELGIQGITIFQCGASVGLCVQGTGKLNVNMDQSYSQSLEAPQAISGRQVQEAAPFAGTCSINVTGATGVCGTVNQISAGISRASVKQTGVQHASAPKTSLVAERQDDPFSCCTGDPQAQLDNPNNGFDLVQDRTQLAQSDIYLQLADSMEGSCLTSGACTVGQRANQNGDITMNSCSGGGCDILITCPAGGGSCTASSLPPPTPLVRRRL